MYGSYKIFFQCFYMFVYYGYILSCFMEKKPCCSGYKWNDTKESCIRCSAGYYSLNCSERCRYPNFGDDCQQECLCEQEFCNPAVGCRSSSVSTLELTVPLSTKRTTEKTEEIKDGNEYDLIKLGILFVCGIFVILFAVFVGAQINRRCQQKADERRQNTMTQSNPGGDLYDSLLADDQRVLPVQDGLNNENNKQEYDEIQMDSKADERRQNTMTQSNPGGGLYDSLLGDDQRVLPVQHGLNNENNKQEYDEIQMDSKADERRQKTMTQSNPGGGLYVSLLADDQRVLPVQEGLNNEDKKQEYDEILMDSYDEIPVNDMLSLGNNSSGGNFYDTF